jgi:chemotaxis signal transduction protein
MTAVFVPGEPSATRPRRAPAFRRVEDPPAGGSAPVEDRAEGSPAPAGTSGTGLSGTGPSAAGPGTTAEGYVRFEVGGTSFAVAVGEVREIVRAARLELLPAATPTYGHAIALVDARGRSVPVVDLRSDRESEGDVLLPLWRHQAGLVVDRVTAVQTPRELAREHDEVPAALPSYARGVLRPVDGGRPVLLIALPDAAELDLDATRPDDQRLGRDLLAADDRELHVEPTW